MNKLPYQIFNIKTSITLIFTGISLEAWSQALVAASGDISPTPPAASSNWNIQNLDVGNTSSGQLNISGGGNLNLSSLNFGRRSGGKGEGNINGSGSIINSNSDVNVGSSGEGILKIQKGGVINSETGYIARLNNSKGDVLITGSGSQWNTNSWIYVGNNGTATLTIADGGLMSAKGIIDIGRSIANGSKSIASVTGTGSRILAEKSLNIGRFGLGELLVSDGALVTSQEGYLGRDSSGGGEVTISHNGKWEISEKLQIGEYGNGKLIITSNGFVKANTVTLGNQDNSNGSLYIDNGGILESRKISKGSGQGTIESNGGVLRASENSLNFIENFDSIYLKDNGIYFDTQDFHINVSTKISDSTSNNSHGSLIKKGTGTLLLTGLNTYSGGTYINQGRLIPGNNSALGSAKVSIGGYGSPASMLVLNDITLENSINIQNHGVLYGTGSVGTTTIHQGGTIKPGLNDTDIGILTINGDLEINGGKYKTALSTDGSYLSGLIKVNGSVTLKDALLYHSGVWSGYELGNYFTVLEADRISGKFTVSGDYAFVDIKSRYTNNIVQIGLERNKVKFSDLAFTRNQKSTANALDQMNSNGFLDDYVSTISKKDIQNTFDLLSGEVHATLKSGLLSWTDYISQNSSDQLQRFMTSDNNQCSYKNSNFHPSHSNYSQGSCNENSPDFSSWIQGIGNWRKNITDGNAATSKSNSTGIILGANYSLRNMGWNLGGFLSYGSLDLKSNNRNSSADIKNYTLGLNLGKVFHLNDTGKINIKTGVNYTHHAIKTNRNLLPLNQALNSRYGGNSTQIFGEIGYNTSPIANFELEPFLGINLTHQNINGFYENGGFSSLQSNSESKTYSTAILGIHAKNNINFSGSRGQIRGTLGLKQALGSRDFTRTMAFSQGSPNYLIWGVPRSKSSAILSIQALMEFSPHATLEAGFSGEFGKNVREQSVHARVRWSF